MKRHLLDIIEIFQRSDTTLLDTWHYLAKVPHNKIIIFDCLLTITILGNFRMDHLYTFS